MLQDLLWKVIDEVQLPSSRMASLAPSWSWASVRAGISYKMVKCQHISLKRKADFLSIELDSSGQAQRIKLRGRLVRLIRVNGEGSDDSSSKGESGPLCETVILKEKADYGRDVPAWIFHDIFPFSEQDMYYFQMFEDAFTSIGLALTPSGNGMLEFTRIGTCRVDWKEKKMASEKLGEIKMLIIV
jgi:hypothetical protein